MAVDGTYRIEIESPMGKMGATIVLKTDGAALSGSLEGQMGKNEFSGGSVTGDEASWSMEIDSPMGKMELTYKVTVTGDDIAGEVKAGNFGTSPLTGKRA
ncbi:MAG: hypothetical protein MUO19_01730 [Dehalococcoidales bacterium]|nr:hypothetical protein [Dehalococcoidales bacterium]